MGTVRGREVIAHRICRMTSCRIHTCHIRTCHTLQENRHDHLLCWVRKFDEFKVGC
jgi:hypothetical protein